MRKRISGRNFRRIASKIHDDHVLPHMDGIADAWADLGRRSDALVRQLLAEILFAPPPVVRRGWFSRWRAHKRPAAREESAAERDYRIVAACKAMAWRSAIPCAAPHARAFTGVLGAIAGKHGRLGADSDLLAKLVARHVCNSHGSWVIGQLIAPMVAAAIEREGYARVATQEKPVLVSLKGASAAGKSSLRPMLKQLLREQGMAADGYATISPDVWRRLLLDYETLGPARKYAGHLTSRELMVIDGKLDRYIRDQADRIGAIPHLLVDRFRFDSFTAEKVGRVLHDTYARYVDTMYMYFIVTPPEETVERGWQRALERGRYKAVEDFLAHGVEAYRGMPKLLFKWLASPRPEFRYVFLDNRVPRGSFPKTIARGDRGGHGDLRPGRPGRHRALPEDRHPRKLARRGVSAGGGPGGRGELRLPPGMRAAHPAHRTGRARQRACLLAGQRGQCRDTRCDVLARALGNAELAAALAGMAPPVGALCEKSAPAIRRDMLA
jgi:thymidylate kinase